MQTLYESAVKQFNRQCGQEGESVCPPIHIREGVQPQHFLQEGDWFTPTVHSPAKPRVAPGDVLCYSVSFFLSCF